MRPSCPPSAKLTTLDLREYLSALHEAGYAKSSISRRLACLRTFFRFAQREGLTARIRPGRCGIRVRHESCRTS